jgi:hypothetical protein
LAVGSFVTKEVMRAPALNLPRPKQVDANRSAARTFALDQCEMMLMSTIRAVLLAMAVVTQSASGQELQTQPRALDRTAPSSVSNTDRNANAPEGPALEQEPHGSGSVYEELDALRNESKSKEQGG